VSDHELASVLVLGAGTIRSVPIEDRLFVGRECAGIDEAHRLVLNDPEVSRNHLEIRLDSALARAHLIDSSKNGTWLNGRRVERAVPVRLKDGDAIKLGSATLEFHAESLDARHDSGVLDAGATLRGEVRTSRLAMAAGDVLGFTTLSQQTGADRMAELAEQVFGALGASARKRHGTVSNYAGDAFLAVWERDDQAEAAADAIDFALSAQRQIDALITKTGDVSDQPLRMAWGVALGDASTSALQGTFMMVVGDTVNLSFRLASLAGREGRAPVLVNEAARDCVEGRYAFGEPLELPIKGRSGTETVFPLTP
jgi:class 3 adenylate cyclase